LTDQRVTLAISKKCGVLQAFFVRVKKYLWRSTRKKSRGTFQIGRVTQKLRLPQSQIVLAAKPAPKQPVRTHPGRFG